MQARAPVQKFNVQVSRIERFELLERLERFEPLERMRS
jgi:hypothetical protein